MVKFKYTVQRVTAKGTRQDFIAGFDAHYDAMNFAEAKWNAEDRAASYYVWHEHGDDSASSVRTFYREGVAA